MTNTRFPELAFGAGGYRIALDPGEALFPGLVALFGAYYYLDTRGLPGQSVLYAHPLLYVTLALALLVVAFHIVDIEPEERDDTASSESGDSDVKGGSTERKGESRAMSAVEAADRDAESRDERTDTDRYFNRHTAAGLVVASVAYFQLVQLLGFLLPSVAFCGVVLYMFGERNFSALVGYSIGFSAVVYAVFGYWLNVPIQPLVVPI
ncbi:tripartite tricarboxylate transporter TctB family protein [Halobacteriales archaeon QS_3_64_16]|nr:MAG: tripartite tricarboxylate transporter TctB family protein [Halobacteriales archaeon QS_3_64_16]